MEKATAAARNYNSDRESLYSSGTDCDEEALTFEEYVRRVNRGDKPPNKGYTLRTSSGSSSDEEVLNISRKRAPTVTSRKGRYGEMSNKFYHRPLL